MKGEDGVDGEPGSMGKWVAVAEIALLLGV